MSTKTLNIIIGASLVGIIAVSAYQIVTSSYSTPIVNTQLAQENVGTPKQSISQVPADNLDDCTNIYFAMPVGTEWTYDVEMGSESDTTTTSVTTTLIKRGNSELVFESRSENSEKTITNQMVCKKSGIYGFPLLLVTNNSSTPVANLINSAMQKVLIAPRYITTNQTWKTTLAELHILPNAGKEFIPALAFRVTRHSEYTFPNGQSSKSVDIEGTMATPGFANLGSIVEIKYTLAELGGITAFNILLNIPGQESSHINVKTTGFMMTSVRSATP